MQHQPTRIERKLRQEFEQVSELLQPLLLGRRDSLAKEIRAGLDRIENLWNLWEHDATPRNANPFGIACGNADRHRHPPSAPPDAE